eukprot:CAMPEP_0170550760 /NCGR_PEP_ID=MMETSP0211-20121228/8773_1 /TAXON_ID=311385 /ORGANISM="Pseudokeronopsis sp., Strain OXSARD2" /LENGTH=68 /DNA_ID=CAMNT_0010857483 /DNA_START=931 /DNA_END=1137 /DNA_ORIENTATION=-
MDLTNLNNSSITVRNDDIFEYIYSHDTKLEPEENHWVKKMKRKSTTAPFEPEPLSNEGSPDRDTYTRS